jgi:fumarylacetoacetase
VSLPVDPSSEIDDTHDPSIRSWVESADGHTDFPLQNLPFGIFEPPHDDASSGAGPRGGIRIGDAVLDLRALAGTGLLRGAPLEGAQAAAGPTLNGFFGMGAGPRRALRRRVHSLLRDNASERAVVAGLLRPVDEVVMHLPATVGDYTDFYAGINHAVTVGKLFRPDNPLLPNYKWVPIGFHGRASSVRLSGQAFRRPRGQVKTPTETVPSLAPTRRLDFELELGIWLGRGNEPGAPVPIADAAQHIAGYSLLNDWSARDIQSWEYQPLGPFLSKNFATTVSAWVITPEALAPYRSPAPSRPPGDPAPLPYLDGVDDQLNGGLDVSLEVLICTARMRARDIPAHLLSSSSTRYLYWTVAQLIAHHTSGGCDLRPGDLLGSGTISAPTGTGYGSLLEMTGNGSRPLELPSGESRTFLEDGDEIFLRARAERPGAAPVGFGECRAVVLPATTSSR